MLKYILALVILVFGCASSQPPVAINVPVTSSITSLPADTGSTSGAETAKSLEKLEDFPSEPILSGDVAPKDGFLYPQDTRLRYPSIRRL